MSTRWLKQFACGWILFFPPQTPVDNQATLNGSHERAVLAQASADIRAPLSQWTQERAFDSAEACQAWKTMRAHGMWQLTVGVTPFPEDRIGSLALAERLTAGRCLPAPVGR
jgi:hypothetical protein